MAARRMPLRHAVWILRRRLHQLAKPHAVALLKAVNRLLRRLLALTHRAQMAADWNVPPSPEWFDHYIDLHYQWGATGIPLWAERGCFSLLAIAPGSRLLELC